MQTSITDFLDKEYIEYPYYVLENRAIPSMIDGFKKTQRKIAETARRIWKGSNTKPMKVVSLTGELMSKMMYHHGDSSASSAIIGMSQDFKNGLSLFEGIGQFGSLRNTEAGAPRYISVKPSKWFNKVYLDNDLTECMIDDGIKVEPKFFLPIIPMILVNGGSGIAVGYSSDILNRNPLHITKACIEYLSKGKITKDLQPWWSSFNGDIIKNEEIDNKSSYILKGKYEIKNSNTLVITEFPPSMSYEKIESLMNKLEDEKKIVSYEDSSSDSINIIVKLTRKDLSEHDEESLEKMFKLSEKITENLTCLNEDSKIETFTSVKDIIKKFVNFRLSYYDKRKSKQINEFNDKISKMEEKMKFINAIINEEIIVNKKKRKVLEKELQNKGYINISSLLSIPIYQFTKEELDKTLKNLQDTKKELEKVLKVTTKSMYLKDLRMLLKDLSSFE